MRPLRKARRRAPSASRASKAKAVAGTTSAPLASRTSKVKAVGPAVLRNTVKTCGMLRPASSTQERFMRNVSLPGAGGSELVQMTEGASTRYQG